MWAKATMLAAILLANALMCGCGGGNAGGGGGVSPTSSPTVSTTAAQNGAVIVSLASATPGAAIYYTVDGSTPSASSQQYQAPFLVASNLTLKSVCYGHRQDRQHRRQPEFYAQHPVGNAGLERRVH